MAPGFWRSLFKPPTLSGATLNYRQAWIVPAPPRPIRLATPLRVLLTENGIVALEGLSIDAEVKALLQPYVVAPKLELRPGTAYPTSKWLHVRATDDALKTLNELANSFADPEVCDHLYAYEGGTVLLEWHDAFGDPIQVAGTVSPAVVAAFCSALGVGPAKPPSHPID